MSRNKSERERIKDKYGVSGEYARRIIYLISKGMAEEDAVREFLRYKAERQAYNIQKDREEEK